MVLDYFRVCHELIARFINVSVGSKKKIVDKKVNDEKEGNSTTIHITLHVITVYETNVCDTFLNFMIYCVKTFLLGLKRF